MAPPSSGSLLRWISHQRAMSCRTRLRVDCDLGTLPVNVRTSRGPSLSMIRQCRKAKSKGSSFFSEKSTLNIGLGWVRVILLPLSLLPPTKKPSDPFALLAPPVSCRAVSYASGAFLPISLIQRASNESHTYLPTCSPAAGLVNSRGVEGRRSAIWCTFPLVFVFCSCSQSATKIRDWMPPSLRVLLPIGPRRCQEKKSTADNGVGKHYFKVLTASQALN
jgi:hypothetical protein